MREAENTSRYNADARWAQRASRRGQQGRQRSDAPAGQPDDGLLRVAPAVFPGSASGRRRVPRMPVQSASSVALLRTASTRALWTTPLAG